MKAAQAKWTGSRISERRFAVRRSIVLERREEILALVQTRDKVMVSELVDRFGCSAVTIRTDLREMEKEGLLERIHGGAMRKKEIFPNYRPEKIYKNMSLNQQIAECAFRMIEDRETIILDDSTACFYLALEIRNHPEKHLAVVTNSLLAGCELAGLPHIELFVIGGSVGGHLPSTFGKKTNDEVSRLTVDKAFISAHGINLEVGLTAIGDLQLQMKQAILKTTDNVIVLADSTRFGGGYFSVICPISRVSKIVTDSQIEEEVIRKAATRNVSLVIA